MIKNFLLGSLMLLSLNTFAQEGTASPYSFYGIGEVKFKGTIENKSMGGLGILADSIHINLQNPAALSSLKWTTFTVAGTFSPTKLKTSSVTEKAKRTSMDYLAMAFPIGKVGVAFGLMPYSNVGYKILNFGDAENSRYLGSGGLNKAFLGSAYRLTPKLSIGAELAYSFGKIETDATIFKTDVQYGSNELNTSKLSGLNFNTGLIYKSKFSKYDFVSSASFAPSAKLTSNNSRTTVTVDGSGNQVFTAEPQIVENQTKVKLPSKFSFGSGIGVDKKWFVGFESTFQGKASYNTIYDNNATFENASKLSVGGYYVPKYNSFTNYLAKVAYRAGFRHENTGLVVNSESIKDTAFTLGLGLPVGGSFSNINLGVEFGKRGTTNAGLIQENYMNFSVGLSFNDRWFVKRKYD